MSIKIALAGNPNCGKTTLFNNLTGSNQGITKGVEIYVRKVAPLGDPMELTVRNYELSVRKADAEMIEVV